MASRRVEAATGRALWRGVVAGMGGVEGVAQVLLEGGRETVSGYGPERSRREKERGSDTESDMHTRDDVGACCAGLLYRGPIYQSTGISVTLGQREGTATHATPPKAQR